jgi:hypothetical protein
MKTPENIILPIEGETKPKDSAIEALKNIKP